MSSNMPLFTARKGSVSIAIFEGQYGKSAVLQKSYLKKEGNPKNKDDWVRSQINLFLNELPQLKLVVDEITESCKDEIQASLIKKE